MAVIAYVSDVAHGPLKCKILYFIIYIKCIIEIEYLLDFGKKYGIYISSSGFLISCAYCQIHVCTHMYL